MMDFKHLYIFAFSNISLIWKQSNFPITNEYKQTTEISPRLLKIIRSSGVQGGI